MYVKPFRMYAGFCDFVKVLIDQGGVQVDTLGEFGTSALFDACYFDNTDVAEALLGTRVHSVTYCLVCTVLPTASCSQSRVFCTCSATHTRRSLEIVNCFFAQIEERMRTWQIQMAQRPCT